MLKLDAEDSDGDDVDKPPPGAPQEGKAPQKQNAAENNTTPAKTAADWNSAFLKSLNSTNDAPVEVRPCLSRLK